MKELIRDIHNWPKPGIIFRDITPLLKEEAAFSGLIDELVKEFRDKEIDVVAGIESRGFIIGAAMARELGVGFVPIRKKGKLPWETVSETYSKEYGEDALEIHKDAIGEGDKILIVDDLIATGGTALASAKLVEKLGGTPRFCFVIELRPLKGMEKIRAYKKFALMKF